MPCFRETQNIRPCILQQLINDVSGVAGLSAAWCGGQICCLNVLGVGKWIACLISDSCQFSRYISDLI